MSYQDSIFVVIQQFTGQRNMLTLPVALIEYTGSRDTALFLSQLLYWTDRTKNEEGWIYKTYQQWQEEIYMTEYEVRKARKHLESLGVLETTVKKANGDPTVHYRIKQKEFLDSFLKNLKERTCKDLRNDPLKITESLTYITTELTTEKNNNVQSTLPGITLPQESASVSKQTKRQIAEARFTQAASTGDWSKITATDMLFRFESIHNKIFKETLTLPSGKELGYLVSSFKINFLERYFVKPQEVEQLLNLVLQEYKNDPNGDPKYKDRFDVERFSLHWIVDTLVEKVRKKPVPRKYDSNNF